MAALTMINNGRTLYEIDEAHKKLVALTERIVNYESVAYIINQEIYYVLKYKRAKNNITKDMVLLELIKKFTNGVYIKTPEVKKIIGYITYDSHPENNDWFFKNIECGYVPTPAVLETVFKIMSPESKLKLYELFPTKVDTKQIFNFEFLTKSIFTTSDIKKIDESFEKFKIIRTDVINIITNNAFDISHSHKPNNLVDYTYNILNYMINYNINLDVSQIINLISVSYNINLHQPNNITPFQKSVLDKLPNIIQKISHDDLKKILLNIFSHTLHVKHSLNFIKTYCKYDKYNETNIHELIKDSTFQNFPFELFSDFYSGYIDKKLCNLLFLTKHHTFIRNIIRVINDEYESYIKESNTETQFNQYNNQDEDDIITDSEDDLSDEELPEELERIKNNPQKIVNEIMKNSIKNNNQNMFHLKLFHFDLKSFKDNIKVKLTDIFELSFEYGSIPILDYFLNNKYVITEDMVLNNFSRELMSILQTSAKKGFYITEKCFDHILLNMFMSSMTYDHKRIQQVSIYVNDDEEFSKFATILKQKWDLYYSLSSKVLDDIKSTIDYLSDKKVTNEMLILCNSKLVRAYLLRRMEQERLEIQNINPINSVEPVKKVKKIIVKKIVKVKKSNNNI